MIRNRACAIALSLCVAACTPRVAPDDVEIFQAIVQSQACKVGQSGKYAIVSDRPASLGRAQGEWSKWLADAQVLKVSLARAEQRRKWPLVTPCGSAVRVVDDSFVAGLFERHKNRVPRPWTSFYAAFPEAMGLYRVSAPVLDATGTAALVYLEVTCDLLCGAGSMAELKKHKGRWQVVTTRTLWIS
jgi:hypothetical protein